MKVKTLSRRAKRCSDFFQRSTEVEGKIYTVTGTDFRYIPVNPMSDEPKLLKKLGIKPRDCTKVDCYWLIGNDVVFLEIHAKNQTLENQRPGLYAKRNPQGMVVLFLTIVYPHVSRINVEKAMLRIAEIGIGRKGIIKKNLSDCFKFVTSLEI